MAEIYQKWHYLSGPKLVHLQVRGSVEELPEGLQTIVTEAGATQEISRERLLYLCGQRSYVEGAVVMALLYKLSVRISHCHKRMILLLLLIR